MRAWLIPALLSLSLAHAGPVGSFVGGAMQGQALRQCMATCQQGDGQCYQGCSSAYGQQSQAPAPQTYQPVPMPQRTDYQCVSRCTASGLQWGLCQQRCSY